MSMENHTEARHIIEEAVLLAQRLGLTKSYDISVHVMVQLEKKFRLTRKKVVSS